MTAIVQVNTWRVREGRLQEFMATTASAKKIHERLGAKIRVWQSAIGGQPMTLTYVGEHSGWEAFGLFHAKLQADSEWQNLVAKAVENPSADLIQNSLVSEIAGL